MRLLPLFLLLCILISVGCHRKMHTGTSTTNTSGNTTSTKTTSEPVKPLLDSADAVNGVTTPTSPVPLPKPVIIVDAHGNFAVTEKDLPPDASKSILSSANARAYTPAELKTLSYRYKQIPPRILYVPTELQKKNTRGTYYVFAKKYWYWRKANGYFYLDENYYK